MHRSHTLAPRLLAGIGTLAFVAAVGLFASSRPAHTAGGPIPVVIANAPLAVLSRDTDSAARQPFQDTAFFHSIIGKPQKGVITSISTTVELTVPDGKRLVLQGVSITEATYLTTEHPSATLTTTVNDVPVTHTLGYFAAGPSTKLALPYTPVTVYADPGTPVTLTLLGAAEDFPKKLPKGSPPSAAGPEAAVTGYLVDVP